MYSIALLLLNVAAVQMDRNVAAPTKMSQFTKVDCQPLGSNPGGVFEYKGEKYYVKVSRAGKDAKGAKDAEDHMRSEFLATNLYALQNDLQYLKNHLIQIDHSNGAQLCPAFQMKGMKYAIATKWVDNIEHIDHTDMEALPDVRRGLAMDVWLAHYNHVGNYGGVEPAVSGFNMKRLNGKACRIGFGGVFEWKASGVRKGINDKDIKFSNDASEEWNQYQVQAHPFMMSSAPSEQSAIFTNMTPEEKIDSLKVVADISENDILNAVASAFPEGARRKQLQQMLIDRQQSLKVMMIKEELEELLTKKAGSLTANDVKPFHADYFILPQSIQATIKQANPNIEKEIFDADLAIFCSINTILLNGSNSEGKIKQAQMWDQLKVHGWGGYLLGKPMPEALATTLGRHLITKQGTLHTTLQQTVKASKGQKMSIEELQKIKCPK